MDVFKDDFGKQHTPWWWKSLFEASGLLAVEGCHELEDAQALYEDLVLYEHEYNLDPLYVENTLRQIEWSRHNRPRKSLFTITAHKK